RPVRPARELRRKAERVYQSSCHRPLSGKPVPCQRTIHSPGGCCRSGDESDSAAARPSDKGGRSIHGSYISLEIWTPEWMTDLQLLLEIELAFRIELAVLYCHFDFVRTARIALRLARR